MIMKKVPIGYLFLPDIHAFILYYTECFLDFLQEGDIIDRDLSPFGDSLRKEVLF